MKQLFDSADLLNNYLFENNQRTMIYLELLKKSLRNIVSLSRTTNQSDADDAVFELVRKLASIDIVSFFESPNRDSMLIESINEIFEAYGGPNEREDEYNPLYCSTVCYLKQCFSLTCGDYNLYLNSVSEVLDISVVSSTITETAAEDTLFLIIAARLILAVY